ncbi:hypothetical protein F4777DRAFT_458106 [Nemania sp. FL0916]|nr:hypothetical protein F4777DRAFT_458106 [Nemania sp. FL0916]
MGRIEPTVIKPPAAFRRDARAKQARATLNKLIPALLSAHPRAQQGIERCELIVDPAAVSISQPTSELERKREQEPTQEQEQRGGGGKRKGHREGKASRDSDSRRGRGSTSNTEENTTASAQNPHISLCVADTLTAARSLIDQELSSPVQQKKQKKHKQSQQKQKQPAKVGILNMASPLSPGGGFLNGATSQEESLCMRTTLLPALHDHFYRLPELGVVYTPDVLVFRGPTSTSTTTTPTNISNNNKPTADTVATDHDEGESVLPKIDRWFVDVATAAMLRLPETSEDGRRYARAADRELAVRKMRAVLRVFAAKGCSCVVLGAWGCGAYGNPVTEIAEAWRQVLLPGVGGRGYDNGGGGGVKNQGQQQQQQDDGEQDEDGDDNNDDDEKEYKEREMNESIKGGQQSRRKRGKAKSPRSQEKETWGAFFDQVVFAIKDPKMAAAFAAAFGEHFLLQNSSAPSSDASHDGGSTSSTADPVERARVDELRAKIAELKIQAEQAKSSHLRAGLETVLKGLRRQLPADDDWEVMGSGSEREDSSEGG